MDSRFRVFAVMLAAAAGCAGQGGKDLGDGSEVGLAGAALSESFSWEQDGVSVDFTGEIDEVTVNCDGDNRLVSVSGEFTVSDSAATIAAQIYRNGVQSEVIPVDLTFPPTAPFVDDFAFDVVLPQGSTDLQVCFGLSANPTVACFSMVTITSDCGIDTTPPNITVAVSPAANAAGWHNETVFLDVECDDPESGIAFCDSDGSLADEGDYSLFFIAVNNDGLFTEAVVPLKVDTTLPTVSSARSLPPNANGWNNTPVDVTCTCNDPDPVQGNPELVASGIASCSGPFTVGEGGGQAIACTATDIADNQAVPAVETLNVDLTDPEISYSGALTYDIDDMVEIDCNASDALSGIDTDCVGVHEPASNFGVGEHTVTETVTDRAGNQATASVTFTVTDDGGEITTESICALATEFASTPYHARHACRQLARIQDALDNGQNFMASIRIWVFSLWVTVSGGFSAAEAATLRDMVATLLP